MDKAQALKVLIVDDDLIQGTLIRSVCSRAGYATNYASSFEAAAKLIATRKFDCITIDLSLGDRDGIELLRMVAACEPVPKVIVISGCERRILDATVRMARAAGILDTMSISKPIDLAKLREVMMRHSQNRVPITKSPDKAPAEVSIEQLLHGFHNGEIYAAFQPKIQLSTGKIVGCEALARWDSPQHGTIGPDVFIPLAEQGGCIKALTLRMLRDAMEITRDADSAFVAAVNLSATLLSDTTIVDEIDGLLDEVGVTGKSLMIEVTETMAMENVHRAMDILLRLRIKGIGVSMDDFGTGYSSLSALARMPFCELKVDRSFVKDCLSDADMWKVTASSVAIAHEYNMTAVAEGIEDIETWRALDAIGCDIGQGYVFSSALRRKDFQHWCEGWNRCLGDTIMAKTQVATSAEADAKAYRKERQTF